MMKCFTKFVLYVCSVLYSSHDEIIFYFFARHMRVICFTERSTGKRAHTESHNPILHMNSRHIITTLGLFSRCFHFPKGSFFHITFLYEILGVTCIMLFYRKIIGRMSFLFTHRLELHYL